LALLLLPLQQPLVFPAPEQQQPLVFPAPQQQQENENGIQRVVTKGWLR
jgi:hypothetical protein